MPKRLFIKDGGLTASKPIPTGFTVVGSDTGIPKKQIGTLISELTTPNTLIFGTRRDIFTPVTNSTSEEILATMFIPKNSMKVGCTYTALSSSNEFCRCEFVWENSMSGSLPIKAYYNTSASLSGAVVITSGTLSASSTYIRTSSRIKFNNSLPSTSSSFYTTYFDTSNTVYFRDFTNVGSSGATYSTFDITQDTYIIFTVQPPQLTDVCRCTGFQSVALVNEI